MKLLCKPNPLLEKISVKRFFFIYIISINIVINLVLLPVAAWKTNIFHSLKNRHIFSSMSDQQVSWVKYEHLVSITGALLLYPVSKLFVPSGVLTGDSKFLLASSGVCWSGEKVFCSSGVGATESLLEVGESCSKNSC